MLRRQTKSAGPRVVLRDSNPLAAEACHPNRSLLSNRLAAVVYYPRNQGRNAVGALDANKIPTFVADTAHVARAIKLRFGQVLPIGVFHSTPRQTAGEAGSGARSFAEPIPFNPFICPLGAIRS